MMPNTEHGPALPILHVSALKTRAPSTAAAERMSHSHSPAAGCCVFKLGQAVNRAPNKRAKGSKTHLQQRLPSASSELKCVIESSERGQAKTRTLSPRLAEALPDRSDAIAAASGMTRCSCLSAGVPELQCRAASIHDAAWCRQVYGANPPELEFERRRQACSAAGRAYPSSASMSFVLLLVRLRIAQTLAANAAEKHT